MVSSFDGATSRSLNQKKMRSEKIAESVIPIRESELSLFLNRNHPEMIHKVSDKRGKILKLKRDSRIHVPRTYKLFRVKIMNVNMFTQ
jgi:hypothetical protein